MSPITLIEQKLIYESIIYHDGRSIGKMLMEADLSTSDITSIFNQLGQRLSTEKSNKTVIGKGADKVSNIVSSMTKQWEKVKDSIANTGPVRGFDAAFQSLKDTIRTASGPSGKITKAINKYRDIAENNPVLHGAILAGLTAIAGMATGGVGLPYIVGGFRTLDRLLQGDSLSRSLMSGGLAGGLAYGGQQLYKHGSDLLHSHNAVPTPNINDAGVAAPTVNTTTGGSLPNIDNASQFNDICPTNTPAPAPAPAPAPTHTHATVPAHTHAPVPEPDLLKPHVYDGPNPPSGVPLEDTPVRTLKGINPDNYIFHRHIPSPNPSLAGTPSDTFDPFAYETGRRVGRNFGNSVGNTVFNSAINFPKGTQLTEWVNLPATLFAWQLAESLNKPYGHSVLLTEAGRKEIFRRIDEGFWDAIKGVGSALSTAIKKGWNSAKHKLTADDFELKWRRYAKENKIDTSKPVDSDIVKKFLEDLLWDKFKDPNMVKLVEEIFYSMGILTMGPPAPVKTVPPHTPTPLPTPLPPHPPKTLPVDEELVRDLLDYVNNYTVQPLLKSLIKRIAVANGIMIP